MATKTDLPWNVESDTPCRRIDLLGDLVLLVRDLGRNAIPFVGPNIYHVYVHFFDVDGHDIGNLYLADALDALWNDVFLWSECGPEDTDPEDEDERQDRDDLDLRQALRLELQTH